MHARQPQATDHQRVLATLQRVDETAEQRLVNQELRDAVLDAEDGVSMLEQQLRIHQLHKDCVAAIQVAQERLATFEREVSYAHSTTRQDDEQYARECGLAVDGARFLAADSRLMSLRGLDVARDRLARIAPTSDLAKCFVKGAGAVLDQAEQVCLEHKIDTTPWILVLDDALSAVERMVNDNAGLFQPLASLSAKIAELQAEAGKLRALKQAALDAGDVVLSEAHVKAHMALLEGVSDLIQEKLRVLGQIEAGPMVKALAEARRAHEQLSASATSVYARFDPHLADLQSDAARLEQYRARARQNELEASAVFDEQRAASDAFLSTNLAQQTQCWREMLRIEAALSALAEERREEVERRVRGYEREVRRRCDVGHFVTFADTRKRQLEAAVSALVTEKRVGAALTDLVDKAVFTLAEEVATLHASVHETKRVLLTEHAAHFREQYLTVGELLFRKERLLEECDKKIVELRMQQEIAMSTLDPRARLIAEQRSRLERQRDDVHKLVESLRAKSAMYVDAFRPSDVAIRVSNGATGTAIQAADSIEELRGLNGARLRALDKYFLHMSVEAGRAEEALRRPARGGGGDTRVHPRLMATQAELDAEAAEIEAARQVIANNKRKALHLLVGPGASPSAGAGAAAGAGGGGAASDPSPESGMRSSGRRLSTRRLSHVSAWTEADDPPMLSGISDGNNNHARATTTNPTTRGAAAPTGSSMHHSLNDDDPTNRAHDATGASGGAAATAAAGPSVGRRVVHSASRASNAERLAAALRVSALGLGGSLEPCGGAAIAALDRVIAPAVAASVQRDGSQGQRADAAAAAGRGARAATGFRPIEPDPHVFDDLRLGGGYDNVISHASVTTR